MDYDATIQLAKIKLILEHFEEFNLVRPSRLIDALNRIQSVVDMDGRYNGLPHVFLPQDSENH
jgi:hypothetical protein